MKLLKILRTIAPQSLKRCLLMVFLVVILISFSSALSCYQETANASHSTDGNCILNYTGVYYGFYADNMIDGNYATGQSISTEGTTYYVNYTLPLVKPLNATLKIKWSGSGIFNYSINKSCLSRNDNKLMIFVNSTGGFLDTRCRNNTDWIRITYFATDAGSMNIYDEGIDWDLLQLVENNQTYSSPVLETSTNQFSINITYNNIYYSNINAYLNYNGVNYIATTTDTVNNKVFTKDILAPLVSSDTNITFYWIFALFNGTSTDYFNSTINNQTVTNFNFGLCNASNKIPLFNFTQKSEINRNQLLGGSYSIQLTIGNPEGTISQTITANASLVNSFALCLNNSIANGSRIDYILQYSNTSHSTEYYTVQNYIINNTELGKNITLYPITIGNYTNFIIRVKDGSLLYVSNAVVQIYRKYVELGDYLLVEAPLTDSLGQVIGHLQKNDVLYTIKIIKNGQLLYQFDNIQVYCNEIVSDCILNLQFSTSSTNPDGYINYKGITYTPSYNYQTKTYSIVYSVTDGSEKELKIYGWILSNTQNQSVCSNTLSASSGTVNCVFSGTFENSTILINAYVDNQLLFVDYVNAGYQKGDSIGNIRYILLAFMIPLFVMFSLTSGAIAIIFYLIGLLFGIGIYLINTQSIIGAGSFLIWLIIAGIILMVKIMKGGVKNG